MPGTFYHVDDSGRPRPTVIATNGYGATVQGMHFGHSAAAVRRGYNCLIFDGPAPRRVLYKQGIHMRPDGENIVTPVVDYALSRHPEIDPARIALIGWSFGDEVERITGVLPNSGGLAISGQTSDPW